MFYLRFSRQGLWPFCDTYVIHRKLHKRTFERLIDKIFTSLPEKWKTLRTTENKGRLLIFVSENNSTNNLVKILCEKYLLFRDMTHLNRKYRVVDTFRYCFCKPLKGWCIKVRFSETQQTVMRTVTENKSRRDLYVLFFI